MIENDDDSFSIFHNNLISLIKNFENLQSSILGEVVFNFNVIGITETKINDSNSESAEFSLPGYEFEFVPTPLAFGGVGMFIDETLHYTILYTVFKNGGHARKNWGLVMKARHWRVNKNCK